ncbi:MAG: transglutaminase domain-containing protein [Flavobacteriales bacterium]|nr:transglutaminase domain-containing protein [Flavobacteriales bacterium]
MKLFCLVFRCLFFVLLLNSCRHKEIIFITDVVQHSELHFSKSPFPLEFINDDTVSYDFLLVTKGKNLLFSDSLIIATALSYSEGSYSSGQDSVLAVFDFVHNQFKHYLPDFRTMGFSGQDMHHPARFFNVYGFGLCDDAAAVFVNLCKSMGFKSRVWGLDGHVVSEVFYDDAWHFFDPHRGVYLQLDGEILSIDKITSTPEYISKLYHGPLDFLFENILKSTLNNKVELWYDTIPVAPEKKYSFHLSEGESLLLNVSDSYIPADVIARDKEYRRMRKGEGVKTSIKNNLMGIYSSSFRISNLEIISEINLQNNICLKTDYFSIQLHKYKRKDGNILYHNDSLLLMLNDFPVYTYEIGESSGKSISGFSGQVKSTFVFNPDVFFERSDTIFEFQVLKD